MAFDMMGGQCYTNEQNLLLLLLLLLFFLSSFLSFSYLAPIRRLYLHHAHRLRHLDTRHCPFSSQDTCM